MYNCSKSSNSGQNSTRGRLVIRCKWPWTSIVRSWKLVHTSHQLSTHQNASWDARFKFQQSWVYSNADRMALDTNKAIHMLASYWARLGRRSDVWKCCSIQVKKTMVKHICDWCCGIHANLGDGCSTCSALEPNHRRSSQDLPPVCRTPGTFHRERSCRCHPALHPIVSLQMTGYAMETFTEALDVKWAQQYSLKLTRNSALPLIYRLCLLRASLRLNCLKQSICSPNLSILAFLCSWGPFRRISVWICGQPHAPASIVCFKDNPEVFATMSTSSHALTLGRISSKTQNQEETQFCDTCKLATNLWWPKVCAAVNQLDATLKSPRISHEEARGATLAVSSPVTIETLRWKSSLWRRFDFRESLRALHLSGVSSFSSRDMKMGFKCSWLHLSSAEHETFPWAWVLWSVALRRKMRNDT